MRCLYCEGEMRGSLVGEPIDGYPGATRTRYECAGVATTHPPAQIEITRIGDLTVAAWVRRVPGGEWETLQEVITDQPFMELWRPPKD